MAATTSSHHGQAGDTVGIAGFAKVMIGNTPPSLRPQMQMMQRKQTKDPMSLARPA